MKKDQQHSTSLLIKFKDYLRSIEQAVGIYFLTLSFKQFFTWVNFWGGSAIDKGKSQTQNGTTFSTFHIESNDSNVFKSKAIKNTDEQCKDSVGHWVLLDKLTKIPRSFIRWLSVTKKTTKILLQIYPIVWRHYSNFGDILTEEEQYHHYRWMEKSKQIMLRDCYTCKHCGKAKTHLQVFPVYTDENNYPWELDEDCLETVCDHCLEVLKKDNNHLKITGKLGFLWSSGKLDVSTLTFKP